MLILAMLIILSMSAFEACIPTQNTLKTDALNIGDYVQFGQYQDQPILWRVIEDDANPFAKVGDVITGDPLLFSNMIVCTKAFDAAGQHGDNNDRLNKGSNLWETSNIRAWLNSSAKAGAVTWPCSNPPTKDSVDSNDYASEKGFLAADNFTEYERNLIKPVTQKSLLYYVDSAMAEGGLYGYDYRGQINTIVANYHYSWYHTLTDSVFLLDPKQIDGVYKLFGSDFGSFYKNGRDDYWLRAPDSSRYIDSSAANVLYISSWNGKVFYSPANNGSIGIRPALTLNLKSAISRSGDGSYAHPYVITRQ